MTVRRIAVVAYHSSPLAEPGTGDSGGMTVYVREVAEAMARGGVATDIFTRATIDVPHQWELSPAVRVRSVEAGPHGARKEELSGYLDDFVNATRALATSQHFAYDVVHSHYWQSGLVGARLAAAWGVPLVHSSHTLGRVKNIYLAPGDRAEPESRLNGEGRVTAAADVMVASTEEEGEHLARLYEVPADQLKIVPPGVDHDLFFPGDRGAARRGLGIDADDVVMLYAGRIQALKGLDLAVRATAELESALDRRLRFVIVGGASGEDGAAELTRLRRLAADLGLGGTVSFVGPQPHRSLPLYYRAADVTVMCSYSESFGLAALEAQACGTPVVATAVGGLTAIVADGCSGLLVDGRDPSEFAAHLKSLLSDDDMRTAFGAAAHRRAQRFSWDATAGMLLELFECLVREELTDACTC